MRVCCDNLFFELLQVAVGSRDELSRVPTAAEWVELFAMAKKQCLIGITYIAIDRLKEPVDMPETLRLQWFGLTANIAQRNRHLSEVCASLCEYLSHQGFFACILKGQSNMVNYPEDLRNYRSPGDIDVWCVAEDGAGENLVIDWVLADCRIKGMRKPKVLYHHVDWEYKGIECEVHFRLSWMNNPLHNIRLQRWCQKSFEDGCVLMCDSGFQIPTVSFNVVYQLCHIYRHLFNEGIGLRQLLDYYFVLLARSCEMNDDLFRIIEELGMRKFASAVMWVIAKVFANDDGNDKLPWMICDPNEEEGRFLLNEIMMAGNFGKYDTRIARGQKSFLGLKVPASISHAIEKTKHNLRLLSHYPEEVLWEPVFRVYHWLWRKFRQLSIR